MTSAELAASLARELHPLRRPSFVVPVDTKPLMRALTAASEAFRTPRENPTYQKAGEWFLDNHFLVARAARQCSTEIPRGFWRRLPHVGKVPRALHVARAFLDAMHLEFDEVALVGFVEAFQRVAPLTIAELWAIPAMLRLATLESLVHAVGTFFPSLETEAPGPASRLDGAVCVERSVRVLRLLADIDWRVFFQQTSVVDATLREDPANVYAGMVFESRDAYRKVVEEIAWRTKRTELEVARAAIDLASSAESETRESHVGYYLVDRGLRALKKRVGYRPAGLGRVREAMLAFPSATYLGSIALVTSGLSLIAAFSLVQSVPLGVLVGLLALASVPLSSIAVAFTNWIVVRLVPPHVLPKLDLSAGIPDDCRTLVVIPALVAEPDDVDRLLAQLELHYLSSAGPALSFAVLSDFVDSSTRPDHTDILARADASLAALNARHASGKSVPPFHFLHRESRHNPAEGCYMGWERKRGKLEELNRLLRGDTQTSFVHHAGDPAGLTRIRYVLTLDADTQLPLGSLQKLVGLASHPLNQARFEASTGCVVDGYTIVQPRVETHPDEAEPSLYGWIGSGDTALDIYTQAVSDVYQDLFGAGAYVGKGLYDVDAFMRSVEGRVPENTLCSHDLFEGAHGRVALASDVFLLEHYPQHVVAGLRRQHRWTRGDWQIASWLFPRVPAASGWVRNRLSLIDRWKILDNLRRSLFAPATLALCLVSIVVLPPALACFALAPLLVPLILMAPDLLSARLRSTFARWGVFVVLLPQEAWANLDAIGRSLVRMMVTRRKMLEWISAAHTAHSVSRASRALFWREIGGASVLTAILAIGLAVLNPTALFVVLPIAAAWLLAPEVARRLSGPRRVVARALSSDEERRLRRLARRTWAFFETFVAPDDQWLPPDNYQEDPGNVIAHRTSPTNVGLMLVAYIAAFDFGYLGRAELRALTRHSLDTIERLERYHGHLLNWYDTRTLAPLLPRYVSTVDSGNLLAALLVLARGCREAAGSRVVRPVRWTGLRDTLDLLDEAIAALRLAGGEALTVAVRQAVLHAEESADDSADVARRLQSELLPELEAALLGALAQSAAGDDLAALREVRTWFEGLKHQVRSLAADLTAPLPEDVPVELIALADRADALRSGMDFRFLYDGPRKLFHIGYNASSDRLDSNHYDLLESEARIASFFAVVSRQVEPAHWSRLGRPITRIAGQAALLSWGGTMFEYLMPSLFMRSQEHSLLAQSAVLAVEAQIAYGRERHAPWGVSESGFARLDARENYQYRSFGVPATGIRRGLDDDLVIAPYASIMAVGLRPRAVLENLDVLEKLGAMGRYGLYEALDFSNPERAPVVVRSHMAHHQGMIFAALDNFLNHDAIVERFHSDPLVQSGDALLSERLPSLRAAEARAPVVKDVAAPPAAPTPTFGGWTPDRASPQIALLGNGRLTAMVTDTGAGSLRWKGLAVIGTDDDPTIDADGTWIYVKDEESGRVWSATPAPTRARAPHDEVGFHAHQVQMHHRDGGISLRTEIGVAAHDDVEVRVVTLHNESDQERTLSVVTFAEPILDTRASARRHPAFSRMFVECERLEGQHGALAWRRQRDAEEPKVVVVQRLVWDDGSPITWIGTESDRGAFVGRRRTMRSPALVIGPQKPGDICDATVDPAIVLGARVVLAPHAHVQIALVTSVGATRALALDLARRFGSLHTARWVMHDARREVARQLDRAGMTPELLPIAMQVASRLVLPAAPLRPRSELIDGGATRGDVWGHGISGEDPMLVVRVIDPAQSSLVREVLTLHRVLRAWQVPVELVFLDETATGYQMEEAGRLREVIAALGMDDQLGEHGGIRVLATDQLGHGDKERIMGTARVLLDAERGSMADQLALVGAPPAPLPDFAGTLAPDHTSVDSPLPADLVLVGAHGGFTPDGSEYVIRTDVDHPTPAPWCNVIANADVGCLVSESSLGATWSGNSGENRLTPWRNDPITDLPAEVLYLRDEETAQVWSSTPLPAGLDAPTRVRHGAGYTVYERESHGLAQALTVFVALDAPVKIVRIELTNRSPRPRRVTASYYAEWVLGALRESQRAHVHLDYDADAGCLLASCAWNHAHGSRVAFLSADRAPHGYTCDRTEWLGRSGSYAAPRALGRWGLSGTTDSTVDPCAVLQTHLDLAIGQTVVAHFVLGQGADRAEALALARRFRSADVVLQALEAVKAYWDDILGAVRVKTPSLAMDVMLNRWLLYQTLACRFLGRSGFYQSSGAYGFRDQLQDTMGFVHVAPKLVREHIVRTARHQFEEGDVLHWWHPPLDPGVRTRCSDDMVWLAYVVANYVRATGDTSILDEEIPFLKAPLLGPTEHDRYSEYALGDAPASLLEHCRRGLHRASTEGPHGLPLMGTGDWNDGMNRVGEDGKGESIWLGWFLGATMREFAALCDRVGAAKEASEWRARSERLLARVDEVGWDGAWYLRAFYDDGTPLGTSKGRHCRIDSISQSWSVLAGGPSQERSVRAMRSAETHLVRERERLVLLLEPPFHGGLHHPGYIEAYPPGVRENGGQYTHAATWLGCAHARLGDGDAAERIFRLLNPILRSTDRALAEIYRIEPYVLAGDVYGAPPLTGRGGWSWYTGGAAWMWRLGVESILGLTRKDGQLEIDPCIPADWPGFEATVRVDGQDVHVIVENPHHVSRGVASVLREGRVMRVTLGSAAVAAE